MKKEVLLAVVLGFGLGLIITLGIWTANRSLKKVQQSAQPTPSPIVIVSSGTPMAVPSPLPINPNLTVTAPPDEILTNKSSIEVAGITLADNLIIILSEKNEQVVQADDKGNFKASVDLVSGFNVITAKTFDTTGQEFTQSVTVTYTTAKI